MEGSPEAVDTNGPRFTEHFSSPPYQTPYQNAQASPPIPQYPDDGVENKDEKHSDGKIEPHSREYMSPGLESVRDQEAEKEVVYSDPDVPSQSKVQSRSGARICGMATMWFLILVAAIIIIVLGIGLGVGLGVGLSNSSNSSSSTPSSSVDNDDYLIGGALNPAYYSNNSVFNGSGIAFASQAFANQVELDTQGEGVIYFQYYDGSIRWTESNSIGLWHGGAVSETVTDNARNSTPLSAVSYAINGSSTWHLFFIDTDNYLRQLTKSNTTSEWVAGPLDAANLLVNDQVQAGMQACWYGDDYGDSGYQHSPLPPTGSGASFSKKVGMNMWYAKDNTTFEQWAWRDGDVSWYKVKEWPNLNGHAGVGCYSWGAGTVIYSTFVNLDNEIEIYWLDSNTTQTNTTQHPTGVWTKANYSIPGVYPSTSMGYTNILVAQLADNSITGYNITWKAEDTTLEGLPFTVAETAIPGTHMGVTAIPVPGTNGTASDLYVFCQEMGTDITQWLRNFAAGGWSSSYIQGIPAT